MNGYRTDWRGPRGRRRVSRWLWLDDVTLGCTAPGTSRSTPRHCRRPRRPTGPSWRPEQRACRTRICAAGRRPWKRSRDLRSRLPRAVSPAVINNNKTVSKVRPKSVQHRLTVWRPLLSYGYSYKASCARPGWAVICNFWHPGTLTLRAERQSARMSKITNDGLTRSGTWCVVAVSVWMATVGVKALGTSSVQTSLYVIPDDVSVVANHTPWNSLPPDIPTAPPLTPFKNLLKTHYFVHSVIFDIRALWHSALSVRVPGVSYAVWRPV